MSKLFVKIILVLAIFISLINHLSCTESNRTPNTTLELRDSLIYKRGSEIPFTGREYASIENKIIEYEVVNGVKHGEFKLYYENGDLEISGNLANNMNEGQWQYFYESEQIESEGNFKDNLPDGIWKWYYRSGNLREEGQFLMGKRFGLWKQYGELGEVTEEKEFSLSDSLNTGSDHIENLKNNSFQ